MLRLPRIGNIGIGVLLGIAAVTVHADEAPSKGLSRSAAPKHRRQAI